MHQRVREAFFHRLFAPRQRLLFLGRARFQRARDFDHTFRRIRAAIQHHVFHTLAQFRRKIVIHADHAGVDDAHGHARLDGVIQKHGVYRLARRVVAAEREAHIRYTTTHLGIG